MFMVLTGFNRERLESVSKIIRLEDEERKRTTTQILNIIQKYQRPAIHLKVYECMYGHHM